jgi:hypothetical protein
MRYASSIFPEHFGLVPGARPARQHKWWHQMSSWRGEFGSQKGVGPTPFESLLERDFQTILCADYRIHQYGVQPHTLTYWTPNANGSRTKHTYVPDFVARDKEGRVMIIEVKASYFTTLSYWKSREPYIKEAYDLDHGAPFLLFTERDIRIQPRLANFEIMLRHRGPPDDPQAEQTVRDILRILNGDTTIGEVCAQGRLPAPPGADRCYTAIMRLALRGELSLDLSKPFSPSTRVASCNPE